MTDDTLPLPSQRLPSILVVDDSVANLELLSGMLRRWGFEPRPVPNGRLAIQAARAEPPDLILLDVRMPEMDGFQVCAQLKGEETLKDIPVIFISGLTDTADKVKGFAMGAVDYVTKPFQAEEVEARVRTHLTLRSLQSELRDHNERLEGLVAQRTRDLEAANQKLADASHIKGEFLGMISHELRTPANGLLGIGALLIDLCPASAERTLYKEGFLDSSARLRDLIENATLIMELDTIVPKPGPGVPFVQVLSEIGDAHPGIRIHVDGAAGLESQRLRGDRALLKRALESTVLLASSFIRGFGTVRMTAVAEARTLLIRVKLDALELSAAQALDFFNMESQERIRSSAESLGLAPIVAHRIITALGGELKLISEGQGNNGYLEAILPLGSG